MDPVYSPYGAGAVNTAVGLTRRYRVTSEDTGGAFAIWEEDIPEGSGPPRHVHHGAHEVFTILSGHLRVLIGEREVDAGPGDVLTVPPGLLHTFRGAGPGEARVLFHLTPGAGAAFFDAAEGLSPAEDMDEIEAIAARHDLAFVGPPLE